ncbi:Ig-like domain repeat protein [Telmatobacter sp. DSM 110680]|uniref:Ig-like domain repeat protein n=1 Tax=Telmatobacter sp. DSM 110680 TaxID=3036704 RepID=A0AAU7DH06_9BACT
MKLARVLSSLSLAVLAVTGSAAHSQANVVENEPSVLYVNAQTGSDSNSGSSSSPLKTIQAAVNKANSNNQKSIGTKIIVSAGVYRESVNVDPISGMTSAPLTIEAAQNGTAIIDASEVLTGWSADPQYSGAYVANWTPTQTTCALPSGWPSVQPITLHTEILFVNSIAMTQVLAYSDLKPGTFFVNTSDGTVHMWPPANVDPSSATVEVGTRSKTMSVVGRSNIVLRGLVFEHANDCINTSGSTVTSSSNVLLDAVQANWNNWGGLGVFSSSNVTVQNSVGSYNGGLGFQGTRDQSILYSNNETDYNNWRGAQGTLYDWASGGTKLFQMRTTTVQGHSSYNNQAQGLWFDTDNQNITIDNATLVGSYNAALQLERNEGPISLQNSHLCSSGKGLNVLTTEALTVKNNVFYNNGATNKFEAQFYLAGSAGGINITNWQTGQVYNLITTGTVMSGNTFIDAAPGQFVFGTYLSGSDWTDFTSTLNSGNNTWYDSATPSAFRIVNGKNVDLTGWQSATGADYNSIWGAPTSSPASECIAPPAAYPDFHVSVDSSSYSMTSGRATATVRVESFNFGPVTLSVSGLPAGVTASFSNPSLTSGYSILTLTASSNSVAQTVPVNLWAVSGDRAHSATIKLTVNANPAVIGTTTTVNSSASTVNENSPVTLTASVKQTSGSTAPSGSVTFFNGGTSLGTASLSGGTASLSTSALPAGSNSITAEYAGNSTFNASTSSAITVNVNSGTVNTTTTLAASASSIAQNSPVTFTAGVKPASGTSSATGTITFYNGATTLGTATLSSGSATFTTSALPVGSNSITASYSGTSGFTSSTSGAVSVSVNASVVSTTATLISSSSTITENSPVTLTATIKQNSGTTAPTGTVTFYNGTISLGSATLSGGAASIATSALPVGTDSVSAAYSGAVTFNASSSNIVAITVNSSSPSVVNTVTTVVPSATSVTQNSPLTVVVTVKQASGTTVPVGSVNVYNGSAVVATGSVIAGTATLTIPSLPTGTDTIAAFYSGSSAFNPSTSGPVAITVNPIVVNTSTSLTASSASIVENAPLTLTALVKQSSGTATPTGSVNFYNGTTKIGTAVLSAGGATLTTAGLPAGTASISATFLGGPVFTASSSNAITIKISPLAFSTTTTLTASSSNIARGSALTFTADVKVANSTSLPTGTVTFFDASQAIGTASLSSGVATLTSSTLPAGTQTVTATYSGTTLYRQSTSNAVTVAISAPATEGPSTATVATSTVLASSAQQADQGFTIALTATVKPSNGSTLPTGTVDFNVGNKKIGSASLSSGRAYLTTSSLPTGDDPITATYMGNSSFGASTSSLVTVKIQGPDFTVEATPSSVSTTPGQSVDVSLRITPMDGFNQSPSMTCTGLPAGSTCTFGSAAKQSDGTSTVKMTIHTAPVTTSSNSAGRSRAPLALAFLPLLLWISSKRRKEFHRLLSLSMLLIVIVAFGGSVIGCGGHSSSSQLTSSSTTVNVTVNAQTSTGLRHTASVALTLM